MLRDTSTGPEATLPDSSVICAYLDLKQPQPALYPAEAFARARALWYEEYADTALNEVVGSPFFGALVVTRLMGKEQDVETAEDTLKNKMPPLFSYLDKELTDRDFLVGDSLTIADISVVSQFVNFRLAGGSLDAGAYPNLAPYVERLHEWPSIKQCMMANQASLDERFKGSD